ncbi:hypothetical protein O6H91_18G002800 [Diphasiastrum complanatum]|uniref:Uncharacterized protein n=2 Tax=Diphasiastrum complanatum TaxID=34168 RepID=A0ACC2AXK7_DIPCM|nr:hypothetical protein O6H91_18G002800 [Diphasiastrum complanatum]KAJ7522239.1 hypothetical protein O6H91_18G002800 [Diphasiastrum complanatum]
MGVDGTHIGEAVRFLAKGRAHQAATIFQGRERSGAEVMNRVAALSAGLQKLGLQSGDRVAIAALNSDWYLEWLLAVPCAGGIIAPLNYRWSAEEASAAMEQIDPTMLVVDQTCFKWCSALKCRCKSLQITAFLGEELIPNSTIMNAERIINLGAFQHDFELHWAPDEIALICFTSGTTGAPKGVAISHTALLIQALNKIAVVGYSSDDVFLHTAPFCHIGGLSSALAMIMTGGCSVILPKFRADAVLTAINEHLVSAMITIPTMVSDLLSLHDTEKGPRAYMERTFPTVRILLNGGGSLSSNLLETLERFFPSARIFSAYGMTETCSSMSFMLIRDPDSLQGSLTTNLLNSEPYKSPSNRLLDSIPKGGICVGTPAPHVEIRVQKIQKEENMLSATNDSVSNQCIAVLRSTVACHEIQDEQMYTEGHVLTRGPQVMKKYWGQPKETAAVFREDGWLDTGDVGWMDENGRLWLRGRSKDMIKSGGENIHSSEVESTLLKHPAISATLVFGVPGPRLNEAVVAVVLLRKGWKWAEENDANNKVGISYTNEKVVSSALLRIHCYRQGLSRYKVPKYIGRHVEPFPVTSTGKVKKTVIRNMFLDCISRSTHEQNVPVIQPLHTDERLKLQSSL